MGGNAWAHFICSCHIRFVEKMNHDQCLYKSASSFVGPLSSILNNRFGPRVTSIVGAVIASVGYIASFFARNIGFLYISMGVVVGESMLQRDITWNGT